MIRLYANRGTVGGMWRWARSRTEGLIGPFRQHEKALKGIAQSAITPFVLLGLLFPLWFVSKRLAALIMFLLWISAIYQLAIRLGRRAKSRPAIQRTIAEQPESSA